MQRFRLLLPAALALAGAASLPNGAAAAPAGNAEAGQAIVKQRCLACHTVTPGQKGAMAPNLAGVVGRKAASTAFAYSPALKASGLTWTKHNLDTFLSGPQALVPGTRMFIQLSDPGDRANVIAYLAATGK